MTHNLSPQLIRAIAARLEHSRARAEMARQVLPLRPAMQDETPLSPEEVAHGRRLGLIARDWRKG